MPTPSPAMDDPTLTPASPHLTEPKPAGVWLRAGAFAVDLALIGLSLYVLEWLSWTIFGSDLLGSLPWLRRAGIPLYFAVTTARYFQTPGQGLAGLRISRVDFHPIGVGKGLWRTILFFVFLPLFPISLIVMLFNRRGRALHDYACSTWAAEIPSHSSRRRAGCRVAAAVFLAYCCLQAAVGLADSLEARQAPDFLELAQGAERVP